MKKAHLVLVIQFMAINGRYSRYLRVVTSSQEQNEFVKFLLPFSWNVFFSHLLSKRKLL
jgi:hypothetical protein